MLKIGTKQRLSQVMNSVTRQKKKFNSGLEQKTFLCCYGREEYKIDLIGFELRVHCLVPPYCRSASLLSPKKQE